MGQGPSLFEHYNFNGKKLQASVGDWQIKDSVSYPNFVELGWNDVASSLQVPDGFYADLYEHINYDGAMKRFGPGDYPNLGNLGWNDKVSSAVFYKGTPPVAPAFAPVAPAFAPAPPGAPGPPGPPGTPPPQMQQMQQVQQQGLMPAPVSSPSLVGTSLDPNSRCNKMCENSPNRADCHKMCTAYAYVPEPAPLPPAPTPAQMPQSPSPVSPYIQRGSNIYLPPPPLQGGTPITLNQIRPTPAPAGPLVNVTGTWLNEEARQSYNITDNGDSIDIPTAAGVEQLRVMMRTPQQLRAANMNKVFVSNGQNAQFSDRRIAYTINLVKAPSSTAPATVAPFTPSGPDEANRDRYQGMTNLLIGEPDEYNMITSWYVVPGESPNSARAIAERRQILARAQEYAAGNNAAATQLAVNMGFLRPAPAGQRRDVSGYIALWLKRLAEATGMTFPVVIQQPAGAMGSNVFRTLTPRAMVISSIILGVLLLGALGVGGVYLYRRQKKRQ